MRVALYARVSTNNGQDPEMQLRELREYCQRRGWEIINEYVDVGISGTRVHREAHLKQPDAQREKNGHHSVGAGLPTGTGAGLSPA